MNALAATPVRFAELAGDSCRTPVAAEVRPASFPCVRRQSASQSSLPSAADNNGGEASAMSLHDSCKKLQRKGFSERFSAALRRRLFPNTSLTVQRFAHLLDQSERTVWTWLSGGGVRGEALVEIMNFFGDDFAAEVRGVREEIDHELARIEVELARIKAERRAR